jgi:hypothetical protein
LKAYGAIFSRVKQPKKSKPCDPDDTGTVIFLNGRKYSGFAPAKISGRLEHSDTTFFQK